jgi:hypothetical protein
MLPRGQLQDLPSANAVGQTAEKEERGEHSEGIG